MTVSNISFNEIPKFLNNKSEQDRVIIFDRASSAAAAAVNSSSLKEWAITPLRPKKGSEVSSFESENIETLKSFRALINQEVAPKSIQVIHSEIDMMISQKMALTCGKVREIYKRCIADRLDAVQQLIALNPEESRVVWLFQKGEAPKVQNTKNITEETAIENRLTIQACLGYFTCLYGQKKVLKIAERYGIEFNTLYEKGLPLTVAHLHQMTVGLNDITIDDVVELTHQIRSIVTAQTYVEAIEIAAKLPTTIQQGLLRELNIQGPLENSLEEFIGKIRLTFSGLTGEVDALTPEQFNFLMKLMRVEDGAEDTIFSGKKVEGVINSDKATWGYTFFYSRWYDDKERIQLYHKIMNLHRTVSEDQIEVAYDELIAKALVKKEMDEGMLIPAAPVRIQGTDQFEQRWYIVKKRVITGEGKLFYHLAPATNTYDARMPERIEQRSTSSDPATIDALNTVIADLDPVGVGYGCSKSGLEDEVTIFVRGTRPLVINGHSLGGTLVAHTLLNVIEYYRKFPHLFPKREITLRMFDCPGIRQGQADEFIEWTREHPSFAANIAIHYHISRADFVAGAGDRHLGHGVAKESLRDFSCQLLSNVEGAMAPELLVNAHQRSFYLTRRDTDFTVSAVTIEEFDAEEWRKNVELGRVFAGLVLAQPLKLAGAVKTALVGSRTKKSLFRVVTRSVVDIAVAAAKIFTPSPEKSQTE